MKGGKKRTSEPRRTANEEELAEARVDPDRAAPAYEGHAVLQGEALVSEDEEEASLRKLRKRDQPSLVRLVISLNVGALLCAFAYVAFQAPNNFAIGGASGFSIVLSTLVPALFPFFVLCDLLGGSFRENSETTASGWFSLDALPPLDLEKTTPEQLRLCLEASRARHWETVLE